MTRRLPIVAVAAALLAGGFVGGRRISQHQGAFIPLFERAEPVLVAGAAPQPPATWSRWSLLVGPFSTPPQFRVDENNPAVAVLSTPHWTTNNVPYPFGIMLPLDSLRRGDWICLRLRFRATTARSAQVSLSQSGPHPGFMSEPVSLVLTDRWQQMDVLWHVGESTFEPQCRLEFDGTAGDCELADARLVKLNWLDSHLPLPDVRLGAARSWLRLLPTP